ncbi:pilin [Pandoraea terrigena]|uniref:Fimbrial protein n=1 Tax=Pandoraea terrigena TaxID=2508292 RepID=A0A5E4TGV4_9BURK|nr:pilin [Pandoraea terrigena]VVD85738.1 Fimbrial protein [Pandoraea terrigena]
MRRFGHRTSGIAKSRGFTLIELMIVLAIIGVLVMAGVPYLQNYLVRARVVEGLGAGASAKALVSENAMHGAPFNSGWQAPSATDNVNAVTIDAVTGNVTVAYTQRAGDGALVLVPTSTAADGAQKALTVGKAPAGQIVWTCYAQGREGAPNGATLPGKLAPPECRAAAVTGKAG